MDQLVNQIRQLSKDFNNIAKAMMDYEKKKIDPVANVYLLERKLGNIEKLCLSQEPSPLRDKLLAWHSQETRAMEKYKDDFRINFGQELSSLFKEMNKKIRGQYPLLRIGWYTIKTDFQLGEAVLFFGPEIEKIKTRILLKAEQVYETLKKFDDNLRSEKILPEVTLKTLRQAYENRLKKGGKNNGDRLSLIEVLNEFVLLRQSKKFLTDPSKAHYQEYPRIRLSYLLYALKMSSLFDHDMRLHVATFDATVDKINALWVPENEEGEGTHYSHISFGDRT